MSPVPENPPRAGVVLLNWNQYDDTACCLQSLRGSICRPAAILVFDNGSADGSAEKLQAELFMRYFRFCSTTGRRASFHSG